MYEYLNQSRFQKNLDLLLYTYMGGGLRLEAQVFFCNIKYLTFSDEEKYINNHSLTMDNKHDIIYPIHFQWYISIQLNFWLTTLMPLSYQLSEYFMKCIFITNYHLA